MKALIVDDERNVRNVIRQLGDWDVSGITMLLEASNGYEALDIVRTENPDIIFTDIKMPRMTGLELIEELNTLGYTGKIILVTGYDDYTFMRKAIQLNSFDYLLKPIDADAFDSVLNRVVTAIGEEALEDGEIVEEARRLRSNQIFTSACTGGGTEELAAFLPADDELEMSLLSFYHTHLPEPHMDALRGELQEKGMGNVFAFLEEENLYGVLTVKGQWVYVEEWVSGHIDLPIRLVQGELPDLDELSSTFSKLQGELQQNHYRSIRSLDELESARRIQEIVSYVETYYMEDISLDRLSKMFFLTREHISRTFKKETGLPLSKFVAKLRIEQAKVWLIDSDETIYSIATMLGYQDEKYFSKLFKKVTGFTPYEFRSGNSGVKE